MNTSYKAKAKLSSLLFFALLLGAFASAFSANISPLTFGNDATDNAKWQRLVKYKLWATGSVGQDAISFETNAKIEDSKGYTGSAKGNFRLYNDQHRIGGPILFNGGFQNQTGNDHFLTGPTHFKGYFNVASNGAGNNEFNGNNCLEGGRSASFRGYESCVGVPDIDADLDVPEVLSNVSYSHVMGGFSQNGGYRIIDVPKGTGPYNIHITGSVDLPNNGSLYIRMPYGGRSTRIIIDGDLILKNNSNIQVIYLHETDNDNNRARGVSDTASVTEYAGDLLFYIGGNFIIDSGKKIVHGTYIFKSVNIWQDMSFAGQLLASEKIQIQHNFSSEFIYVPFEGGKVDTKALAQGELTEGLGQQEIQFRLDKDAAVNVSFSYCYIFSGDQNTLKADRDGVVSDAHRDDVLEKNIPICGISSKEAVFKEGTKVPVTKEYLTAYDDELTENRERFKIRVFDLKGATLDNGQKSGEFYIYINDNDGRAAGGDTTIVSYVSSDKKDSIGYEDIAFAIKSFPAFASSDGKTRGTRLASYKVKIEMLPAKGTLTYNGNPVKANDVITSGDLANGLLTFKSDKDDYGDSVQNYAYTSFTFKIMNVNDSISVDSYTMSITMKPTNDMPNMETRVIRDSVFENASVDSVIATFKATDIDMLLDKKATIRYSLEDDPQIKGYAYATDVFEVDSISGELKIKKSLNYNDVKDKYGTNTYCGKIVATDNGVPGDRKNVMRTFVYFFIKILEIEHVPEIIPTPDSIGYVTEGDPIDKFVLGIKGTDKNREDLLKLSFSIQRENENDPFPFNIQKVGNDSAYVYIDSIIDYETMPHRYDFLVVLKDKEDVSKALSDTLHVTIFVKDVNEAPIVSDVSVDVVESKKKDDLLLKVDASDPDIFASPSTELTYSMGKVYDVTESGKKIDVSDKFVIDPLSGKISFASSLDLDKYLKYVTTVTVTDNGSKQDFCTEKFDSSVTGTNGFAGAKKVCEKETDLSSTANVTIKIKEFNYEPEFDTTKYVFEVAENSQGGTVVGKVHATDKNSDDLLSFYLNATGIFDIAKGTNDTAIITVAQGAKINYEAIASHQYNLTATVSDGSSSGTASVVINILDVNEKPDIVNKPLEFNVDENSAVGTLVDIVKVKDEDTWTSMSYSLVDSTAGATDLFEIAPTTCPESGYYCGKLTVKLANINYENTQTYFLKVIATDDGDAKGFPPSMSDTSVIKINVIDKNDTPAFVQPKYNFTIDENSVEDSPVGQVEAKDEDNNKLTYTIVDITKNASKYFKVDPSTGEITTTNVMLDYESVAKYEFKVIATDDGIPNLSDTTIVTVNVNDVNERPTLKVPSSLLVNEGETIGTVLGTLTSDDLDTAKNFRKHKYYAISGDTLLFAVDSVTGEISVRDTIYDPTNKIDGYNLSVRVLDYSTSYPFIHDGSVYIKLKQANEPPQITPTTYYVFENSPEGTFVGDVNATDDSDPFEDLKFEIVGNSDEFVISEQYGRITVKAGAKLDYESCSAYIIKIRVTDHEGAYKDASFKIVVKDVNEPPVLKDTEFHIAENAKGGASVGSITATDPEDSPSMLKFELDSGFVSDEFEVLVDGKIVVKKGVELDYEKVQVYTLKVKVTDTGDSSTTGEVTIFIDNVNEAPVFEKNEFHVPENSPAKTEVGQLVAHDEEDADSELVYGLSEASGEFEVSKSGKITVKEGAHLDYETRHEYVIKVYVRDTEGAKTEGSFKIHVDDVREIPTLADTTLHVKENVPTGTKVGVLIANNPEKDKIKFELISKSDKFKVKEDGTIVTTGSIDYESQKEYKLKVVVHGNDCADTATVTIKVDNVVEVPKVIITRAEHKDSIWNNPTEIFTNVENLNIEWTVNGKYQPDTLASFPKDSTYKIVVKYEDPTMDSVGTATLIVHVSNAIPKVTVKKADEDTALVNGLTIVEQVDEGDTNYYVNKDTNDIIVKVKDGAMGVDTSFKLKVSVDSLTMIKSSVNAISAIAKEKISLEDTATVTLSRKKLGKDMIAVSYEKEIDKKTVVVTYYTDKKGKLIKNDDGVIVMDVVYSTTVDGKDVDFTYHVNGKNGKKIDGVYGGMYEVSYTYRDTVNKKDIGVRYGLDANGKVVKNEEGNYGFQVSYSYTNAYGNTASKSISIVVDKVLPVVKIVSPEDRSTVRDRGIQVEWTVDGEKQDTLTLQALKNGLNPIVRIYRDKAGNEVGDSIMVRLKNPKELTISLVNPVTIIKESDLEDFYADNPPKKGESFAVSVYNQKKGHEVETIIGGDFKNKKGSMEEPYKHSHDKHFGPTLSFEALTQRCGDKPAGGLCTLDDVIENDGMISLESGGSRDRKRVSVSEYVDEYCTDEFRKNYKNDPTRAALYHTTMDVKIWIYSNQADFLDYYKFEQDIDDPDYVDDIGVMNSFFELKPDVDGNLKTADGRLIGTGAYIFRTEATITSKLLCDMPDANRGNKIRSKDSMLKNFGYKRPNKKIVP